MEKTSSLAPTPPELAQKGQPTRQQQRHPVRRYRWRWYKCKPLVALMWLAAAMVTVPIWLWLFK